LIRTLCRKGFAQMDKIYPVSLFAVVGLFGQWTPNEINSYENVGFKAFLIGVVIALACYQIYRDRCDRSKADTRHSEIRTDLKTIGEKLHTAELAHTRLAEIGEHQLEESRQIRNENSETFRRQWDIFTSVTKPKT
jgi:hypothetical protein